MRRQGQVEDFADVGSASFLGKGSMVGVWASRVLVLDEPIAAMAVSIVPANSCLR